MQNEKGTRNIFVMLESSTITAIVDIEYGQNRQYGFLCTVFAELFTAHLLRKRSSFYRLSTSRYMQNQKGLPNIFIMLESSIIM
jgi:hypothetical protein